MSVRLGWWWQRYESLWNTTRKMSASLGIIWLSVLYCPAGSSETEMQARALREVHDQSSDSLGSSLSMSLGGRSASESPGPCFVSSRRHSLTSKYFLFLLLSCYFSYYNDLIWFVWLLQLLKLDRLKIWTCLLRDSLLCEDLPAAAPC